MSEQRFLAESMTGHINRRYAGNEVKDIVKSLHPVHIEASYLAPSRWREGVDPEIAAALEELGL